MVVYTEGHLYVDHDLEGFQKYKYLSFIDFPFAAMNLLMDVDAIYCNDFGRK